MDQKPSIITRLKDAIIGGPYRLTDVGFVSRMIGGFSKTGVPVTEKLAMQQSAVWACVRVLAETIGALPWHVYERMPNGDMRLAMDHPTANVLMNTPNQFMTPLEMKEATVTKLALRGNAYAEVNFVGNILMSLTPFPPDSITPRLTNTGRIEYVFTNGGKTQIFPAEKVWHVKGIGNNGLVGFSPLDYARESIGMNAAARDYGAGFFKNGGTPSGILTTKEFLPEKLREKTHELLKTSWQGNQNAHDIKILEGGTTFQQISISPEHAQLLETRVFEIQEICRWFRVPPHMIAELTRSTFSNIEQQSQEFVTYTLLPWLRRFEESLDRRVFNERDRGRFVVRFNFEGLLRADSAARATLYGALIDKGVITRNEARGLENLPRSDMAGMDDFSVQAQMIPVSQMGKTKPSGVQ